METEQVLPEKQKNPPQNMEIDVRNSQLGLESWMKRTKKRTYVDPMGTLLLWMCLVVVNWVFKGTLLLVASLLTSSSGLHPSSDALCYVRSFLFLLAMASNLLAITST